MRQVSDQFLLLIAEVTATMIGLFLVGVFFYVETVLRQWDNDQSRADLGSYVRAGTRIVLLLFALPFGVSLTLVAFEPVWARVLFFIFSIVLIVANIDTAVRVRAVGKVIRSTALLANEVIGTVGVAALVITPIALGGFTPSREDLTWAIVLSLAIAFASVGTLVLSAFDTVHAEGVRARSAGTGQSESPLQEDAALVGEQRMVTHNPAEGVYAATSDYVHAIEIGGAQRLVFVAGTMGLDPAGVPGATLEEQLELIWSNIRAILTSAGMTMDNIVRLTSYLRDREYAEANAHARTLALGGRAIPTTAVVAETLDDHWLVEIEVIAAA